MEESLALHHSAIDRSEREAIEAAVSAEHLLGRLHKLPGFGRGFPASGTGRPDRQSQNLARLLQRAGRSAHLPGGTSQVLFMPTNALELLNSVPYDAD